MRTVRLADSWVSGGLFHLFLVQSFILRISVKKPGNREALSIPHPFYIVSAHYVPTTHASPPRRLRIHRPRLLHLLLRQHATPRTRKGNPAFGNEIWHWRSTGRVDCDECGFGGCWGLSLAELAGSLVSVSGLVGVWAFSFSCHAGGVEWFCCVWFCAQFQVSVSILPTHAWHLCES